MKATLDNFINTFTHIEKTITESLIEVHVKLKSHDLSSLNIENFKHNLRFLNSRDTIVVSVIFGINEPIDFYSGNNCDEFITAIAKKN